MDDLHYLINDGPVERDCPYCDQPGGTVLHAGEYLHKSCYERLGAELEVNMSADCRHNSMVANNDPHFAWKCGDCGYVYGSEPVLQSVVIRTDDADVEGYPIEDGKGNVLGHTKTLHGPEQRAAVAQLLGVEENQVNYKGDDEDENGPLEVWGLIGVAVPVLS